MLASGEMDVDTAVRECLQWLSLPSIDFWLLIFDNVDRDHCDYQDVLMIVTEIPYNIGCGTQINSRCCQQFRHSPTKTWGNTRRQKKCTKKVSKDKRRYKKLITRQNLT